MILTIAGLAALTTAAISLPTNCGKPDLSAPMLMTMSISVAPFWTASAVSCVLMSAVLAPSGKPMVAFTVTLTPASCLAQ